MFAAIFSLLGGVFSGTGNAVKGIFYKKSVDAAIDGITKNVDKALPVAERAVETIGKAAETAGEVAKTVGDVATSASVVSSNLADVAKSDNDVAIEMHKRMALEQGSFLTRNVRPFIALSSFALFVLGAFGIVPVVPFTETIVAVYMGARSVDKLGQVFSAASAVKAAFGGKK